MKLHINSGRHVFTNPEARIKWTNDVFDSLDVVFIEGTSEGSIKEIFQAILIAPLVAPAIYLTVKVLWRFLGFFFRSDQEVVDTLVRSHDADRIFVDASKMKIFLERPILWGAANWSFILLSAITIPAHYAFNNDVLFTAALFEERVTLALIYVFGAISLLFAFLAAVDARRNDRMADEIQAISSTDKSACYVVGGDHHKPVAKRLSDASDIEIINPKDESSISILQSLKAVRWGWLILFLILLYVLL